MNNSQVSFGAGLARLPIVHPFGGHCFTAPFAFLIIRKPKLTSRLDQLMNCHQQRRRRQPPPVQAAEGHRTHNRSVWSLPHDGEDSHSCSASMNSHDDFARITADQYQCPVKLRFFTHRVGK